MTDKEKNPIPLWHKATLTVSEAAYTGLSVPTIRAHIQLTKENRDTLPFFTVKKCLRIHRGGLDKWLSTLSQNHGQFINDFHQMDEESAEKAFQAAIKKKRGHPRKYEGIFPR